MRREVFVWIALLGFSCSSEDDASTPPPSDVPDGGDIGDGPASSDVANDGDDASFAGCHTPHGPTADCLADASGCARRTLYLSPTSTFPFAMVTDDKNVYWAAQAGVTNDAYDGTAFASILRISKTESPEQAAAVLAKDQERTTTLVRDGADLFWISSQTFDGGATSTFRRLRDVAKAYGCPNCLPPDNIAQFPGIARRLVRVSPGVFFAVDDSGNVIRLSISANDVDVTSAAPSLAVSDTRVFAGGGLTQRVIRLDPTSGAPGIPFVTVPDGGPDAALPGAWVLGADCDRLFGVHGDKGSFWWSAAANGTFNASSTGFDQATDIASDDGFVYVAQKKGGGLSRGARDGSGFTNLYTGDVWRLAVDDDGVYWGEHAKGSLAGNVFMQPKK